MGEGHKRSGYRKLFYALAIVGVVGLSCWLAWENAQRTGRGETGTQEAPARAIPEQIIGGLILLRPEQIVSAPIVDGFQWPCGAPNGAMVYDAQRFGAMNDKRGGRHTGQDLNGIGGENSDEGVAICAAGRGLVVYSGNPSNEWGNVIILAHRLPGEEGIVQTLYAHLKEREARVGEIVGRGERIGTMGTADGKYLAHLHFEAIPSLCTEAGMPGYHPAGTMNRMNPAELIRRYPAPAIPDALQEVRRMRMREAATQRKQTPGSSQPMAPGYTPVTPEQFLSI